MCYSITQLLSLKFNLEKIAKISNFESYPIDEVNKLWSKYLEYLEENENKDMDYPDRQIKFD